MLVCDPAIGVIVNPEQVWDEDTVPENLAVPPFSFRNVYANALDGIDLDDRMRNGGTALHVGSKCSFCFLFLFGVGVNAKLIRDCSVRHDMREDL